MKTKWTENRLRALFSRYNQKYWRGRLPHYRIVIQDLREAGCVGRCLRRVRRIALDVGRHESDRSIRDTLLHEMCHAAAGRDVYGHGYRFWQQVERLLRRGAPIGVSEPEAPQLRIFAGAIPRRFPLSRKAMARVEARRQRSVETYSKTHNLGPPHVVNQEEIMRDFANAGLQIPWMKALLEVGRMHNLIDVGGKPISRWAARVLAQGKKVHRRHRRDQLEHERLRKRFFGEHGP